MLTKVHIARKDAGVKEHAIQLLSSNPSSEYLGSHAGLVWINTIEETLYMEKNGSAVTVYQDTVSLEPYIKKVDVDDATLEWNGSQIIVKEVPSALVVDLDDNLASHSSDIANNASAIGSHATRISTIEDIGTIYEFTASQTLTGSSTLYPCENFKHSGPTKILGVQKLENMGWAPIDGLGSRVWVEDTSGSHLLQGDIDDLYPSVTEPIRITVE